MAVSSMEAALTDAERRGGARAARSHRLCRRARRAGDGLEPRRSRHPGGSFRKARLPAAAKAVQGGRVGRASLPPPTMRGKRSPIYELS